MSYTSALGRTEYEFDSIRDLLATANEQKAGDELAGIAADSDAERIAAKTALSELTLETLYENSAVPAAQDEVTRTIRNGLSDRTYDKLRLWTVGDLREFLLDAETTDEDIRAIRDGLTSEMIAAVTKLMSNMDLVLASSKMTTTARCNNMIGTEGTMSFRLQPNDPTDDVENIINAIREGLSYGIGDAVIGINPVTDNVARTTEILQATKKFIREWDVPTQNCVLAHLTTQIEAVENGAPADLLFQSIAGTEAGNREFGIDTTLLADAYKLGQRECTAEGPNVMYFETGQGAELSNEAHENVDQLTLEARCYGLAREYNPFLVNTVVGFIGPEYLYDGKQVTRAGLEDVFMGKLHGLPMGIDACYTNHTKADQNDIENLAVLLTAAGANFFINVPMGGDVMLNYQSNSFHDGATLRQLFDLEAAPAFQAWLEEMNIADGSVLTAAAGDPTMFT